MEENKKITGTNDNIQEKEMPQKRTKKCPKWRITDTGKIGLIFLIPTLISILMYIYPDWEIQRFVHLASTLHGMLGVIMLFAELLYREEPQSSGIRLWMIYGGVSLLYLVLSLIF